MQHAEKNDAGGDALLAIDNKQVRFAVPFEKEMTEIIAPLHFGQIIDKLLYLFFSPRIGPLV
jgi:hypothetical protein